MSRLKKSEYTAQYQLQILKSAKEAFKRILEENEKVQNPCIETVLGIKMKEKKEKE
jgi:hypothetical protein